MKNGFEIKEALEPEILNIFQAEVKRLVCSRLSENKISVGTNFQLEDYHNFVTDELHSTIWEKKNRLFSQDFLNNFEVNKWFNKFLERVRKTRVLDVEGIGYPEVYFRLVRPCRKGDTFGAHNDGIFYTVTNEVPENIWANWLKVWFPIKFEPLGNTIGFYPESMVITPTFARKYFLDKPRPILMDGIEKFGNIILPIRKLGQAVVFSPYCLHQAVNSGATHSRVSVEFAVG